MAPVPMPTLSPNRSPFRFVAVGDDAELLTACQRLRYEVLAEEMGFLDPADHPDGIDRDEYDRHAHHVAALRDDGHVIGTARLVRSRPLGLPLEHHCTFDAAFYTAVGAERAQDVLHRPGMVEIDRIVVAADYRRRAHDGRYGLATRPPVPLAATQRPDDPAQDRADRPTIALGLYGIMFAVSQAQGISHWLAAIEARLALHLDRFGIRFRPAGPEVLYHGPVAPFVADLVEVAQRMAEVAPDILQTWTDHEISPS